jgi:hypothetical protein
VDAAALPAARRARGRALHELTDAICTEPIASLIRMPGITQREERARCTFRTDI